MNQALLIEIFTKSAFVKAWQIKLNNSPWDLTGYEGKLQIRGQADVVVQEFSTSNASMTLSNEGVVKISLTVAQTLALTWTTGTWDLLLKAPSQEAERQFGGAARVVKGVTAW